jgi:hypothetical protein
MAMTGGLLATTLALSAASTPRVFTPPPPVTDNPMAELCSIYDEELTAISHHGGVLTALLRKEEEEKKAKLKKKKKTKGRDKGGAKMEYNDWDLEAMHGAIREYTCWRGAPGQQKRPSIRSIAKKWGVKKSTLGDKIGIVQDTADSDNPIKWNDPALVMGKGGCHEGQNPNLIVPREVKDLLAGWMHWADGPTIKTQCTMFERGRALLDLMDSTQQKYPLSWTANNGPSNTWWSTFFKEYPALTVAMGNRLNEARTSASTPRAINAWADIVQFGDSAAERAAEETLAAARAVSPTTPPETPPDLQTDDYLANAQDFAGKWYGLNVDGMVQFLKESYPHILSVRKIQDDEEAIRRLAQQLCHDPLCHFNFDQKVRTSDCSLRVMSLSCRMTDR